MGGFFRIVLGGAVGAVLGILFCRKQSQVQSGETLELPAARPEQQALPQPTVAAQPQAAAPAIAAPAPAYTPAPRALEVPETLSPSAPVATPAPVQAPPVYVAPVVAAPVYVPPVIAAPVAPPAPAPVAPAVAAPAPVVEPIAPPVFVAPVAAPVPAPVFEAAQPPAPAAAPPAPVSVPVFAEPWLSPFAETPAAEVTLPVFEEVLPIEMEVISPLVEEPTPFAEAAPEAAAPAPTMVPVAEPVPVAVDVLGEDDDDAFALPWPGRDDELAKAAADIETASSEVVVNPHVLDEPIPGTGWGSSPVQLERESQLEEFLPVEPDAVKPYEPPLLVGNDSEALDEEAWKAVDWASVSGTNTVEIVSTREPEVPSEAPIAEVPEEPVVQATPEPIEPSIPAMPVLPVYEQPQPTPDAPAGQAPSDEALGEDLKARIEETRRRIREELDKPFAAVDESDESDLFQPSTPAPAPIAASAPAAVPVFAEEPEAVQAPAAPAPVPTPAPAQAPAPAAASAFAQAPEAAQPSGGQSDYDTMRARIELTRSRLKAKAFDAMMAGEAALLGRDSEELEGRTRGAVAFDSEIEKTVDSTLAEEDR